MPILVLIIPCPIPLPSLAPRLLLLSAVCCLLSAVCCLPACCLPACLPAYLPTAYCLLPLPLPLPLCHCHCHCHCFYHHHHYSFYYCSSSSSSSSSNCSWTPSCICYLFCLPLNTHFQFACRGTCNPTRLTPLFLPTVGESIAPITPSCLFLQATLPSLI